ncbi:hypothetical protein EYC84_001757 [Monilinia fructicola]|uniref:Uncharacterized protein n=1 Tax=Monilinia fructicola TaxID=38448 RepID=A0A5M9JQI3_MONFR|nr:hypothetical protein EYC84_001757 [Monilinia fructicola]
MDGCKAMGNKIPGPDDAGLYRMEGRASRITAFAWSCHVMSCRTRTRHKITAESIIRFGSWAVAHCSTDPTNTPNFPDLAGRVAREGSDRICVSGARLALGEWMRMIDWD